LASKPVVTVFAGLASKPVATVSSSLASKSAVTVFASLASKMVATVFPGLASKPVVGFLGEPQNQGGRGFPGLDLKTDSSDLVIYSQNHRDGFLVWASKSSRLRFVGCAIKPTDEGRRGTRVEI
jgi:hypothetical protein